jgi:leucyl aminopeptidase
MPPAFASPANAEAALPIRFIATDTADEVLRKLTAKQRRHVEAVGFEPVAGRHLVLPDADGGLGGVLFGLEPAAKSHKDLFLPGKLPALLPKGIYMFANAPHDARLAALAWLTGSYRFTRYKTGEGPKAELLVPDGVNGAEIARIAEAVVLGRDLINTPANDMGPAELEDAAKRLARQHRANVRVVVGDQLLAENFPLIHAVGRASARAPRLIDMTWGKSSDPKVTLVGKGVCFDTGGLNIKPDSGMLLMKKDMGGAACVLACAHMIMAAKLKVRLRVLIPALENSISGPAFRPGDVYASRKGLTVEIGNTDAEGRLILADALALADEEAPDLLIDLATLTGAARVALGPDLPPLFTDDDALAADLIHHGAAENDPLWRLPLWRPYESGLDSKIATLNNVSSGGHAGAITAALFLRRFVEAAKAYAHLDIFAWVPSAKPGRSDGGEVQAARAIYALLTERYG